MSAITRSRRTVAVIVAALAASIGVIAASVVYVALGEESEDYAAKIDGESIPKQEVANKIAFNERLRELIEKGRYSASELPSTDQGIITQELIDDRLLAREAARRGVTCSSDEVQTLIDRQRALTQWEFVIPVAIAIGLAAPNYLDVDPAERTPTAQDVVDSYWAHSDVRETYAEQCQRGKLFQSLEDPTPENPKSAQDRSAAIQALVQQLREGATIERAPGY